MATNPLFSALEKADALSISSTVLADNISLRHKDFLLKHVQQMTQKGLWYFIVSNMALLSLTVFRMLYLSLSDLGSFDISFLDDDESIRQYLRLILLMVFIYVVFAGFYVG
ncbi:MAG: hypothetical protein ACRCXB_31185, partial [Aeromonadaceae bacterium]